MINKLSKGYERFRRGYYQSNKARLQQLSKKQEPQIAIVSCCDSRVDPGLLFDVKPGELFVIRNVANLVPPFETEGEYHGTSAALEFAVNYLKVKQIVVLGHANCGGIKSLMEDESVPKSDSFIDNWMQLAAAAKEYVLARNDACTHQQKITACEKKSVNYSLRNLMTYPWIRDKLVTGNISLLGLYYDLNNGELAILDEITTVECSKESSTTQ